jgi:3-hydroxyisobutyrate dehydrogenase/2-hydroxy-3-oxopropionate reductase
MASRGGETQAVAVLGLGAMGSRIAARLLERGHPVTVWNRTPAKAAPLVALGAEAADTPAAAVAGADVAITMLSDPAALAAVTESEGFGGSLRVGTLVEMSTVGPGAIRRLRRALPEHVRVVDAPVLGSIAEAEKGSLVLFVGGSDEDSGRVEPVLRALGTPLRVGPIGSGAAAKLVANSTLFGVLAVLGEAVALGDGLGLDREVLFEVLARTPLAAQAERRREPLETGVYPSRFALSLALKDAELVAEAGRASGTELRAAEAALAWLADAERAGLGGRDYSAVLAEIVRRRPASSSTAASRASYRPDARSPIGSFV